MTDQTPETETPDDEEPYVPDYVSDYGKAPDPKRVGDVLDYYSSLPGRGVITLAGELVRTADSLVSAIDTMQQLILHLQMAGYSFARPERVLADLTALYNQLKLLKEVGAIRVELLDGPTLVEGAAFDALVSAPVEGTA